MESPDRVATLFDRACQLPPDERDTFLDRECGDDTSLKVRIRSLLDADSAADDALWNRAAIDHEAQAAAAAGDPAVGTMLGAYRLVSVLGTGGMGTVYLAERADDTFAHRVAIKRVRPGLEPTDIGERLRTERRILASLEHPNIARLFDGGTDAHQLPYFVMEYVEGRPPQKYANARDLSLRERLALFIPICDAVHHAHQRMVIHRDLKPGNILVTDEGTPKLLDFGIATLLADDGRAEASALTRLDGPAMTVRYASPEQIAGEPLTTATDIYSLGVLLYELLTGRSPYGAETTSAHALRQAVCHQPPIRPSAVTPALRGDVDNILLKALRKAPEDRYTSAAQFADDLRRHLDGRPVVARGDGFAYVAATFIKRHKVPVAAALLLLVTMVGGVITTLRAEARAQRRFQQVRQLAHSVVFDYHDAIESLPGATPVRKRLVSDALTYLDSLAQETPDDPALWSELADAYVRISNVQGNSYVANLGDTSGALTSARKAVSVARQLLDIDQHPRSLRSAALAFDAEASLLYVQSDLQSADQRFRQAADLLQRAVEAEPDNLAAHLELASVLRHYGDLIGGVEMLSMGRTAEGLEWYQRSLRVIDAVLAITPEAEPALRQRTNVESIIASSYMALGRPAEAAYTLERVLTRMERAARPDNQLDRQNVAGTSLRLAVLLMDNMEYARAIPHIARAHAIMTEIVAQDPRNSLSRRNLGVVENHFSTVLAGAGRLDDALAHNRAALAISVALSAADPASNELRADEAVSTRKTAATLERLGRYQEALTLAERAWSILASQGDTDDGGYVRIQQGRAQLTLGIVLAGMGRHAPAIEHLIAAERIAQRVLDEDPSNTVSRSDLARAQSALAGTFVNAGRLDDAREAYTRALATWSSLRDHNALTREDQQTADADAAAFDRIAHRQR